MTKNEMDMLDIQRGDKEPKLKLDTTTSTIIDSNKYNIENILK